MTANGNGMAMKMVVAIIRHERLQEVQDVLDECGVSGVTVTEVKGCGAQRGYTEKYRGAAVHISLRPRIKVEAVSNIYFDISDTNFTISAPPTPSPRPTGWRGCWCC